MLSPEYQLGSDIFRAQFSCGAAHDPPYERPDHEQLRCIHSLSRDAATHGALTSQKNDTRGANYLELS